MVSAPYVGARQGDILEGVHAVAPICLYRQPPQEELLPFVADFRLHAPGLRMLAPVRAPALRITPIR